MSFKRVRVGTKYVFDPVPMDIYDNKTDCKKGDIVTVINLPGAPRANTMGHCYVADENGKFLGMVCTNSLESIKKS
jgi:hypothetical protein